ncbi:MAG TPA: hypothetical protein V6D28_22980 [Leptolyngbyaceae cyanobacterium]
MVRELDRVRQTSLFSQSWELNKPSKLTKDKYQSNKSPQQLRTDLGTTLKIDK